MNDKNQSSRQERPIPVPLDAIREAVESVKFGNVQVIIQDGRVIQIDKTEKIRLG